ncbi:MAG: hypothetical protein ACK4F6_10030 [Hylemonella sp.]
MKIRIRYLRATWLFLTLILSGCAIKTSNSVFGQDRQEIDIDYAALFGEELASFSMATGDKAALRRLQNTFSIKIEKYSKVIDIPYATSAKLVKTEAIGDTTLIVIAAPRNGCPMRHILYSITGKTGQFWELGGWDGCKAAPDITRRDETFFFDYAAPYSGYYRQTYYGGSLSNAQYLPSTRRQATPTQSTAPAKAAPVEQGVATPKQTTASKTSKPSTTSASATAPKGTAVSKSELPAPISFGENKAKPVTVSLE